MDHQMIFIIASLVFGLAVIVGANIWALRPPPETDLQRTLPKEIDELLRSEQGARQDGRNSLRDNDHRSDPVQTNKEPSASLRRVAGSPSTRADP